jgi:REP element-mobilizing transposase RayT
MPQSFTCLHYHIVFSTKHREQMITTEIQSRLYDYIGGVLKVRQSVLLEAGASPTTFIF